LAYYVFLRRKNDRFSARFERTLLPEKPLISADKRSSGGSFLSKLSLIKSNSLTGDKRGPSKTTNISKPIKPPGPYMQPEEMMRGEFGNAMRSVNEVPYRDPLLERRNFPQGVETTVQRPVPAALYSKGGPQPGDLTFKPLDEELMSPESLYNYLEAFVTPEGETEYKSSFGQRRSNDVPVKSQEFI
jgi:hypothetical protein